MEFQGKYSSAVISVEIIVQRGTFERSLDVLGLGRHDYSEVIGLVILGLFLRLGLQQLTSLRRRRGDSVVVVVVAPGGRRRVHGYHVVR